MGRFMEDAGSRTHQSRTTLKICFASRPWDVFNDFSQEELGLVLQNHIKTDIAEYAKDRLMRHKRGAVVSIMPSRSFKDILEQLVEKVRAVFLWVRLVLDSISTKLTAGTALQEIADLPDGFQSVWMSYTKRHSHVLTRDTKEKHISCWKMAIRAKEPKLFQDCWDVTQCVSKSY